MPNELASKTDQDRPFVYEIKINGHLSPQWTDWFEGQSVILEEDGNTLITGLVVDQAALHGLLKKVRDLALPLVSVNRIDSASPAPEEPAPKDVIHDGLPAASFSPTFIDEEDDLNAKEKRKSRHISE